METKHPGGRPRGPSLTAIGRGIDARAAEQSHTLAEVAAVLGVHVSALMRFRCGARRPSGRGLVQRLAAYLAVGVPEVEAMVEVDRDLVRETRRRKERAA